MTLGRKREKSFRRALEAVSWLGLIAALVGCSEGREERHANYNEAVQADVLRRGVLPQFVLDSASEILIAYDLDTSGVRVSFRFPPKEASLLASRLAASPEAPPSPKTTRPGVPKWWRHDWRGFQFFEWKGAASWYVAVDAKSGVVYAWTSGA